MVAGRRLRGRDQQQAAEHQAGRRGDLGVEAVEQDGGGGGEARRLGAGVEPSRQIDQQDHRQAQHPKNEDDPPEPDGRRA
jgi:hypothetical protein